MSRKGIVANQLLTILQDCHMEPQPGKIEESLDKRKQMN